MSRKARWTFGRVGVVVYVIVLTAGGCSPHRYVDATHHVAKVQDSSLCLELVKGDGDRHLCDQFPRVDAPRPLQVGDCVLLRLLPESSWHSRLILKPEGACT